MRILWTLGPYTVFDLVLLEPTDEPPEPSQVDPPTVVDMSTSHERGFGFDRMELPRQNADPYYDDPFGEHSGEAR